MNKNIRMYRKISEKLVEGKLDDPVELFGTTIAQVQRIRPNTQIVIFLDELDRLVDTNRIGDLLKHVTGVRFVFVGVAETGKHLLGNHLSVIRKIDEVYVPPLNYEETKLIFTKASDKVKSMGIENQLIFNEDFVNYSYEDSGGYPYLAHRFGYHAVNEGRYNRRVYRESITVGLEDYKTAVRAMFRRQKPGSDIEVGSQVKEAVGDSQEKEAIARACVNYENIWMDVNTILGDLKSKDKGIFTKT